MIDNKEMNYEEILFDLISNLSAKPEYLKSIVQDENFNQKYFEGMVLAYHLVMDEIITTLKNNEVDLERFNLQDYNPLEILKYTPFPK